MVEMNEDANCDDNDEEEEEIIVFANFEEGTVDKETFQIPNVKLKIIGLDSDTPIVQLRDSTFKGEWKDAIGTKLLLEEDNSPEQVDTVFTATPETMLKYKCKTRKILELSKILLKKKSVSKPEENPDNSVSTLDNDESICEDVDDDVQSNIKPDINAESVCEDVNDVVQSTIKPDINTDRLMKDIVNQALSE